jgi:hypothetical protein
MLALTGREYVVAALLTFNESSETTARKIGRREMPPVNWEELPDVMEHLAMKRTIRNRETMVEAPTMKPMKVITDWETMLRKRSAGMKRMENRTPKVVTSRRILGKRPSAKQPSFKGEGTTGMIERTTTRITAMVPMNLTRKRTTGMDSMET